MFNRDTAVNGCIPEKSNWSFSEEEKSAATNGKLHLSQFCVVSWE